MDREPRCDLQRYDEYINLRLIVFMYIALANDVMC